MKQKTTVVISTLLVFCLIAGIYMLSTLVSLQQQIEQLHSQLSGEINMLRAEIGGLRGQISQPPPEEQWVISEQFSVNEQATSAAEVHLFLEWTLKENGERDKAYVLYRAEGEDWQEVEADNTGGANFRAGLLLHPDKTYFYQILTQGETSRTTPERPIPRHMYQPAFPGLEIGWEDGNQNKNVEIRVYEPGEDIPDYFRMEKAEVIVYTVERNNSGTIISRRELETVNLAKVSGSNSKVIFIGQVEAFSVPDVMLSLRISYANGAVNTWDIWPES